MVGPPVMNYKGLPQLMSGPVASRLHTNLREKWIWPREKGEEKLERGSRGRGEEKSHLRFLELCRALGAQTHHRAL